MSNEEKTQIVLNTLVSARDCLALTIGKETVESFIERNRKDLEIHIIKNPHKYFAYRNRDKNVRDPKKVAEKVKKAVEGTFSMWWGSIAEDAQATSILEDRGFKVNKDKLTIALADGSTYAHPIERIPEFIKRWKQIARYN